eukprot:2132866-Pyramimonas_sp.AAC.1
MGQGWGGMYHNHRRRRSGGRDSRCSFHSVVGRSVGLGWGHMKRNAPYCDGARFGGTYSAITEGASRAGGALKSSFTQGWG